jgi:hypothetical protein
MEYENTTIYLRARELLGLSRRPFFFDVAREFGVAEARAHGEGKEVCDHLARMLTRFRASDSDTRARQCGRIYPALWRRAGLQ